MGCPIHNIIGIRSRHTRSAIGSKLRPVIDYHDEQLEYCDASQATESFWDTKAERSNGITHLAVGEDDPWASRCIDRAQRPIVRRAIKSIADALGQGEKRVLDLGCGVGRWIRDLTERFAHYEGVDISNAMLEIAREKHPQHRFSKLENMTVDIEDEFFDFVLSIAVLHHNSYDNQSKMLAEVNRVIRPGGELLMFEAIGQSTDQSVAVFYPRSSADWIALAEQNGFEFVRKTGTAYYILADMVTRIIGSRSWLKTWLGRTCLWFDSILTPLISKVLPERFHIRSLLRFRKVVSDRTAKGIESLHSAEVVRPVYQS